MWLGEVEAWIRERASVPRRLPGAVGDLREAADLAYRTGTVGRALAWDRLVHAGIPNAEPEDDLATAYGLKLFLEKGPIGSWQAG